MNLLVKSLSFLGLIAMLSPAASASQALTGQWITDLQGQSLADPQTSGLTWWNGELLSLGDQSAAPEQRMKIFRIAPGTGRFITAPIPITLSDEVRKSCFGDYLANSPDLEALTWDRLDAQTLITVTEDASRAQLSPECARKFAQTNSTPYPTLLLKIAIDSALTRAQITAVRPVQFPAEANVGNLPNDGIEGLAIDDHQNLYLGLEKNMAGLPAIFKTRLTADFWTRDNFIKVIDANLTLPDLDDRGHPINDLDFMPSPIPGHPGYLIAAARNDDELWVFDLTNRVRPFVQPLQFFVATDNSGLCPVYERVVQTALEGIAVHGQSVYLANDPWKQHYPDNVQCEVNTAHFLKMAPLLFQMPVDPRWLTLNRSQPAPTLPGISGMAQIEADRYLVVQDKKISNPGARLGVLQVFADKAPRYQPIPVANWPTDQMSNDLESVCALPGRPNEFLIAESGSWQGEFGRLFHLQLLQTNYARVLASYPLPLRSDNDTQQSGDQFEGLVCAQKAANRYLLVLGERGGEQRRGSLVYGEFDIAASQILWSEQRQSVIPPHSEASEPFQRDIAELYLESNVLWASAVREAGPAGPFSSFIYQVALVDPQAAEPVRLLRESRVFWQLDGIKVEGLAAPSPLLPGSSLAIGSEDEKLGGVWRSLFAPAGQHPQIPLLTAPEVTEPTTPNAAQPAGVKH
jgi:hypothetical protein